MLRSSFVEVDGTRLHLVSGGQGEPVLFLHGFPEFWYAWRHQLRALARTHTVLAVDLPGCNLSDKPRDPLAYDRRRVGDLVAGLLRAVAPGRRVSLVGHDLGATIAWDVAARHPDLVRRLVAINGAPAAVLARELLRSPEQRAASAYVEAFRAPGAEVGLAAHGFRRLASLVFDGARSPAVFGPVEREAYLTAWARPGALTGALACYRAWDPDPTPAPVVEAPTLVLWGEDDRHLLPGCLDGLRDHARDVRVARIAGATHWVVHEEAERITSELASFLSSPDLTFRAPVLDLHRERELWRRDPDYNCFWSGPDNERGLRLTPQVEAGRVWVRVRFDRDHSGVVGLAHGGLVFTVLDGIMGWLIMSHLGRLGLTREATIEFLAPVHVGQEVEFEAVPDPERPPSPRHVSVLARAWPVGEPERPCARMRARFVLPSRDKAEDVLGRRLEGVSAHLFPAG